MQGPTDIVDECICALFDGDVALCNRYIAELQTYFPKPESFNRWLSMKFSKCLEALEALRRRIGDPVLIEELNRKKAILQNYIDGLKLLGNAPMTRGLTALAPA